MFGLTSQIKRASVSIPLNIAEGYGKRENVAEFRRFVLMAIGSCDEMKVLIDICRDLEMMGDEVHDRIESEYDEIGRMLKEEGILFHTDAVQAAGILPINVAEQNIDMMSVSAHKFNGPKGVGFLYCRRGIFPDNLMDGGALPRHAPHPPLEPTSRGRLGKAGEHAAILTLQ